MFPDLLRERRSWCLVNRNSYTWGLPRPPSCVHLCCLTPPTHKLIIRALLHDSPQLWLFLGGAVLSASPTAFSLMTSNCSLSQVILYRRKTESWLVWLSGLSVGLQTKGSPVRFPVRAHAWVAGLVPSWGHMRGNHTLMFLSLSFSFPAPLSKNK